MNAISCLLLIFSDLYLCKPPPDVGKDKESLLALGVDHVATS